MLDAAPQLKQLDGELTRKPGVLAALPAGLRFLLSLQQELRRMLEDTSSLVK
jgi:hypothetical protein